MKFTVESSRFAECMRKIQPAVGVTKEKKEVTENSVRLTMTKKQKIKEGYIGMAVSFDGKKQLFSAFLINELEMEEEDYDAYISGKKLCDITNALNNGNEAPLSLEVGKNCIIKKRRKSGSDTAWRGTGYHRADKRLAGENNHGYKEVS